MRLNFPLSSALNDPEMTQTNLPKETKLSIFHQCVKLSYLNYNYVPDTAPVVARLFSCPAHPPAGAAVVGAVHIVVDDGGGGFETVL